MTASGPSFNDWAAYRRVGDFLKENGIFNFRVGRLISRFDIERNKPRSGKFSKYNAEDELKKQGLDPKQYVLKIYHCPSETDKIKKLNLSAFNGVPLIIKPWRTENEQTV